MKDTEISPLQINLLEKLFVIDYFILHFFYSEEYTIA